MSFLRYKVCKVLVIFISIRTHLLSTSKFPKRLRLAGGALALRICCWDSSQSCDLFKTLQTQTHSCVSHFVFFTDNLVYVCAQQMAVCEGNGTVKYGTMALQWEIKQGKKVIPLIGSPWHTFVMNQRCVQIKISCLAFSLRNLRKRSRKWVNTFSSLHKHTNDIVCNVFLCLFLNG